MFEIPYISVAPGQDIDRVFESLPEQKIARCNWPEVASYVPEAGFRMFHDGENLYIRYYVDEQGTQARVTTPGGPVYTDSCLECFLSPEAGDGLYYNFEVNCIGVLDYSCRRGREDSTRATGEQRALVKTVPSLGTSPFEEKRCEPWTLTVIISRKAFFSHEIKSFSGKVFKMNVYKCGDNLKVPHFVSWSPIPIEKPDFHRPDYFVPVKFE